MISEVNQYNHLDKRFASVKDQLQFYQNLDDQNRLKIEELKEELQRSRENKSFANDALLINTLEDDKQKLKYDLVQKENQLTQTQLKYERIIDGLNTRMTKNYESNETSFKKDKLIEKYKSHFNSLQNKLDQLKEKVIKLENQNMILKNELDRSQKNVENRGDKYLLQTYQKRYSEMNDKNQLYVDKIKELTSQLKNMNPNFHTTTENHNIYISTYNLLF